MSRFLDVAGEFELTVAVILTCSVVTVGLALAWWSLLQLRLAARHTTLISAWRWSIAGAVLWSMTWFLDFGGQFLSRSAADHLWYASAVVALCPPMAVLGSRRPGTRAWTAFIQIPMLLVLGWPVISLFLQGHEIRGLQIETPQLAAFLLVLLMGAGNYVGTRFTFACFLYVSALCLLAGNASVAARWFIADGWSARVWATGLISSSLVMAARSSRGGPIGSDRFSRLWLDFFSQFGVVWGRRIQDRVNHVASKENWPGRLELHGFEWTTSPDPAVIQRVEHTFRWLLRRFVDPEWIDDRLGTASPELPVTAMTTDS